MKKLESVLFAPTQLSVIVKHVFPTFLTFGDFEERTSHRHRRHYVPALVEKPVLLIVGIRFVFFVLSRGKQQVNLLVFVFVFNFLVLINLLVRYLCHCFSLCRLQLLLRAFLNWLDDEFLFFFFFFVLFYLLSNFSVACDLFNDMLLGLAQFNVFLSSTALTSVFVLRFQFAVHLSCVDSLVNLVLDVVQVGH